MPPTSRKTTASKKKTDGNTASSSAKKLSSENCVQLFRSAKQLIDERQSDPIAALRNAGIKSPLVIVGSERLRVRRLIQWLRDQVIQPKSASDVSSFFGSELTSTNAIASVANVLRSPSLFAARQLVIVYDIDQLKVAAAKSIVESIIHGVPSNFVVVTASSPTSKPFIGELASHGTLVEVGELKDDAALRWIEKEAQRVSGGIEPDAARLLLTRCGSDSQLLASELDKLGLLTKQGEKIAAKLVSELVIQTAERTSFELVQAIARKNSVAALRFVHDLLEQGLHPLQLSSFLSRSLRLLLAQKSKLESGSSESLNAELSNAWFVRQLGTNLNLFSESDLASSLEVLKELDYGLKSSGYPGPVVLELAVQQLARRDF